MKKFYLVIFLILIMQGCSYKELPKRDISNARIALIKVEDNPDIQKYVPEMLDHVKKKYKILQKLLLNEKYDEAKYLAVEIQADIRVLKAKAKVKALEDKLKEKRGKLNLLNHEFIQIEEGER